MKILPVGFKWMEVDVVDPESGEARRSMAMVPHERFRFVCRRQFEAGGEYSLVPHEARSKQSHNFFFACVAEAFNNLPENIADRFPSAEHLRAWALIETGWCDEKQFEFDNKRYAQSLCTFIQTQSPYARILLSQPDPGVKRWVVLVRVPQSQSHAAQDKEKFKQCSSDVLDLLENMTGVARGTYRKETGRHA